MTRRDGEFRLEPLPLDTYGPRLSQWEIANSDMAFDARALGRAIQAAYADDWARARRTLAAIAKAASRTPRERKL